MSDFPYGDPIEAELSVGSWLVAVAAALVALLVAALPYVPW